MPRPADPRAGRSEEELRGSGDRSLRSAFRARPRAGAYATVKAVGAAKRSVDREHHPGPPHGRGPHTAGQVPRPAGSAGELAQLRLALAHVDAGHAGRAARGRGRGRVPRSPSPSSSGSARTGSNWTASSGGWSPNRTAPRSPSAFPTLRERTERIIHSAESLRWAAREPGPSFRRRRPDSLSAQIDVEAGAPAALGRRRSTPPRRRPGPEAPGTDAPAARQSWPQTPQHPGREPAEEPARPAITPPGPSPVYPWQKKARPENTT